jgi:hypothetical protein
VCVCVCVCVIAVVSLLECIVLRAACPPTRIVLDLAGAPEIIVK